MFFADSHMHSKYSFDGHESMTAMALAAAAAGITHICFTDHIDMDFCDETGVKYVPSCYDIRDDMLTGLSRAREVLKDRVELRFGIELGAINHHPELAKKIAADSALDFVIGSVHNLKGITDFALRDYRDVSAFPKLVELYIAENRETASCGCCDVLGHIGYPHRYMFRAGYSANIMDFKSALDELFRYIIPLGIGIEVNTSGLRDKIGTSLPPLPALRLYRECGGEIITTGSDAHKGKDAGSGIKEAYELLREAGFSYVTVFKNRKPEFIKL